MRRAALGTLAALLMATTARADPTFWQRASDPFAQARAKARLRAEQLFDQANDPRADPDTLRELSLDSAALLELGGGAKRDPWQEVLLGRALFDADPGRQREALQLIERGLVGLPASEFKLASLFDLGLGAMLGGELERADRAFTLALSIAWDADTRAVIHRNRGKERMLVGRMPAAVADFRAAVRLARHPEVLALSHFGLGVTLERSGDYPQGMQEIARGVAVRLLVPPYASESALDVATLRWFPGYDVHYFRALSAMSEAAAADSRELEQERYEAALESWDQYLPAAQAQRDRFVPNAERHRQRCIDALLRLKQPGSGRVR
jgi:tetratricopeptide (TPR) repeat protein